MEERFKYIHFKSKFFYNLLILNPSNYIKLIKIQITVNVSSKRRLGQDPTKYQGRLKKDERFTRMCTSRLDCKTSLSALACSYYPNGRKFYSKKEIMGMVHFLGSPTKIM